MLPPWGQTVLLLLSFSESKPFTYVQCEDSWPHLLHGGALSRSYENMDGRYRNGGRGIHSVHDLDVVCRQRRNNMCSVWTQNHWTWSAHFHMLVSVLIPPKRWTDLIIFVFVSVFRSQSTVLNLFSSLPLFFYATWTFTLAAQIMEWSTYPIILCLLEFRLSDCVKRERGVKWYLVPVCHIVCGLFATLCTGPQGHTHIII